MNLNNEAKEIYMNKSKDEFIICAVNEICEDIKKLNIDKRLSEKLLKDVSVINDYVTNVVYENTNYEKIVEMLRKYCQKKLSSIRKIYIGSKDKINLDECDNYIDIIKSYLRKVTIDSIKKDMFNQDEVKIIKMILNDENPYNILSLRYPIDLIALYLERISMIISSAIKKEILKEKLENSNSFEIFYLSKIIVVKNWAFSLPKTLQSYCFEKGLEKLSEIIRKNYLDVTDSEIKKELENMTIKEVSKNNNTQRIIPFSYTNNYKSKDNFENNIAHYFFSDLDDDFTPNTFKSINNNYGSDVVTYTKEHAMSKIVYEYKKNK